MKDQPSHILPLWAVRAGRSSGQITTSLDDGSTRSYQFVLVALPPQPDIPADGDPFTPLALMAKQSEAGRNIPDNKLLTILTKFIDVVAYSKQDEDGFSVPSVWFRAAEEDGE
jgi:hypothetical protein